MTVPFNFSSDPVQADSEDERSAELRLMETTDLHGNIMPYDYYKNTDEGIDYGLAKTATLIHAARDEVDNSMLFDAGDMIQGTPLANYVAKVDPIEEGEVHPQIQAMNSLEYDVGVVGNHEFNYGLDFLDIVINGADYPIVNANVYKADEPEETYFEPYEIVEKEIIDNTGEVSTVNVGVIGFTPPQIMVYDKEHLTGEVITEDIVETAEKFVPQMKEEGADVVIALAHSGLDVNEEGKHKSGNAVYDLAKVDQIDAVLFGHAHENFPGDSTFDGQEGIDNETGHIHGVPSVMPGHWGNHLGIVDLSLTQDESGNWVVDKEQSHSELVEVTEDTPVDEDIVNGVKPYHEATLDYVTEKIGETDIPLHSYFTRVMDDSSTQIVNMAQMDFADKWIDENAPEYSDLPVISSIAPFKGGRQGVDDFTNVPAGDLSIISANDLYIMDNTFKGLKLTGADVKEWLEYSASSFMQVDVDETDAQEILDYNFRPYNFDVIDGINYQIDITEPRRYSWEKGEIENEDAHRIVNMTMLDGTPIEDDQEFIILTNNYRANGGGNFPGVEDMEMVIDTTEENRQIVIDYIAEQGTINPEADNNWSIAPIEEDVTLVFNAPPAGKEYADELDNIVALDESGTEEGYDMYQLLVNEEDGDDGVGDDFLDKDNPHYDNVMELYEQGVIKGYPDGTFRPWNAVSRGQVAVMLTNALELEVPEDIEGALANYSDVSEGDRYAEEVAAVTAAGIFKGTDDGTFDRYSDITRQQIATVLVGGLNLGDYDDGEDVDINLDNVSDSHVENVQILANLNITNQTDDYRGYESLSRAAYSTFLVKSMAVPEK